MICNPKKVETFVGHVCNECMCRCGKRPKVPAESGDKSLLCRICEHHGIGSQVECVVGDWLIVKPV